MVDIDSIHLVLDDELPAASMEALDSYCITTDKNGEYYHKARFRHLRVYSRPGYSTISGSLSKLIYGTNLVRFDYRRVSPALDVLAAHLGLSGQAIRGARITRLEFGVCVELSQPVADYTSRLVQPPRTRLRRHGSTTAFHQAQRVLVFYDKRAEVEATGGVVDTSWGLHVLRYEVRLLKAVGKQIGRPLTAGDLCHPELYALLGDGLLGYLEGITMEERPVLPEVATAAELGRVLARLGLDTAGGLSPMLGTIDARRKAGHVGRENASRQRRYVRDLHADESVRAQAPAPLHAELVASIATAVMAR